MGNLGWGVLVYKTAAMKGRWRPGQHPGHGAGGSPGRDGVTSSGGLELRPVIATRRITAALAVLWVQKRHVLVAGRVSWQSQAGFGCAGIWKLP